MTAKTGTMQLYTAGGTVLPSSRLIFFGGRSADQGICDSLRRMSGLDGGLSCRFLI